jgi:hypothetical protein
LSATRDAELLRVAWFTVQTVVFSAAAFAVARRLPHRAAVRAVLLVPLLVSSLPVLTTLEYGQAHLLTLSLAMAAMLAFDVRHDALGGFLLGAAISIKIFPGLFLLYLLLKRRWHAVAMTLLACAAYAVLAWTWFGDAPWSAFLSYQLPRLASGHAFSTFFDRADFDVIHMGVPGIAVALDQLGASGARAWSGALSLVYAATLVALLWFARRRRSHPSLWLAMLNLAAATSVFLPAAYGMVGTLWLLFLALAECWQHRALRWCLMGGALLLQIVPFAGDLPLLWSLPAATASLFCALACLALNSIAVASVALPHFLEDAALRAALARPRLSPSIANQDV